MEILTLTKFGGFPLPAERNSSLLPEATAPSEISGGKQLLYPENEMSQMKFDLSLVGLVENNYTCSICIVFSSSKPPNSFSRD